MFTWYIINVLCTREANKCVLNVRHDTSVMNILTPPSREDLVTEASVSVERWYHKLISNKPKTLICITTVINDAFLMVFKS